jgi:carboxyl-terminal processing protease
MPAGEGAERAGLLVDDEILAIDGKDVREMSQEDVRRAVRGDVGSTMTLSILRTDPKTGSTEKKDVKVTRTPLLAEKK